MAKIEGIRKLAKQEGLDAISRVMEEYELELSDIAAHLGLELPPKKAKAIDGRKRASPAPKYQSLDGKFTWSGRGGLPRFIKEAIAANPRLTKDDFLIK